MHLISLLAKTTQVPLVALSSALRKLRNLTCLAPITLFVMDKKSRLKWTHTSSERPYTWAQPLSVPLLTLPSLANRKPALHQMTFTQTPGLLTLLTPTLDLKCKEKPLRWVNQSLSVIAKHLTTWPVITSDTETTLAENGKLCAIHSHLQTRLKIYN